MKKSIIVLIISILLLIPQYYVSALNNNELEETYRTEENKVEGEPYLNPMWVEWNNLPDEEKSKWGVIPPKFIVDYVYEPESTTYDTLINRYNLLAPKSETYPSTYNLRNEGYVSPVKNQGTLGLCWDFATIAAIESNALKTLGKSLIFSERQIDYALSNPSSSITEGYNPYGNSNRVLGDAGNFQDTYKLFLGGISPQLTSVWGSYSTSSTKQKLSKVISNDSVEYQITNTVDFPHIYMPAASEEERKSYINMIKKHIMNYGGVSIATITPDSRGGSCYNSQYNMSYKYDGCTTSNTDYWHAMLIIGWNDTYGPDYNGDGVGDGAWILKNSWGSQNQYPYASYYSLDSVYNGIISIEEKDWDRNYDDTDIGETLNGKKTYYKDSNTVEKLKRITFRNSAVTNNHEYKIYVSTTGEEKDKNLLGTIIADNPGIYSLDVDSLLLEEDKFTVYVESSISTGYSPTSISAFTSKATQTNNIKVNTKIENDLLGINSGDITEFNIYSITENIDTSQKVSYKIFDNNNNSDVTSLFTIKNNYVFNDNVLATATVNSSNLKVGTYKIETYYNNNLVDTYNFEIKYLINDITFTEKEIHVSKGFDKNIDYTITPENASNKTLKWSSNNTDIASVDESGNVTGVSEGRTYITASTVDGSNVKKSIWVNIYNTLEDIKIGDIAGIARLKTKSLKITTLPSEGVYGFFEITSDNPEIVTAKQNGSYIQLTAKSVGSTIIRVKTLDGSNIEKEFPITVYPNAITNVEVNNELIQENNQISLGKDCSTRLIPVFTPNDGVYKNLQWTSDNRGIATVDQNGNVTGVSEGTTTIRGSINDGAIRNISFQVTVYPEKIETINLSWYSPRQELKNGESLGLANGYKSRDIEYKLFPEENVNNIIKITSDNPDIATIELNNSYNRFKIVAKSVGSTTIRIKSLDGSNIEKEFPITVYPNVITNLNIDNELIVNSKIYLGTNSSTKLIPQLSPTEDVYTKVIWTSGNTDIASIDENGNVTGISEGETYIYCYTLDGSNKSKSINIKVYPNSIEDITFEETTLGIAKDKSKILYYKTSPETNVYNKLEWTSDNPDIATVVSSTSGGRVTGISEGSTIIRVKTLDGSNIEKQIPITVYPNLITKLQIDGDMINAEINVGKNASVHLYPITTPDTGVYKRVKWTSGNPDIATVDENGNVTGVSEGTTKINVETLDGSNLLRTFNITVHTNTIEDITFEETTTGVAKARRKRLKHTIKPTQGVYNKLQWTSDNPDIATVDSSGYVIGASAGSTTIRVRTVDGSNIEKQIPITVYPKPTTSIRFDESQLHSPINVYNKHLILATNTSKKVKYTITPEGEVYPKLQWTSDNPDIATVDQNGNVTGVSEGTTTIRAYALDGSDVYSLLNVAVYKNKIENIELDIEKIQLPKNEQKKINCVVTPTTNSYYILEWTSDNPNIASVDQNGNITSVNYGTTMIRVKSLDGSNIEKTIKVTVADFDIKTDKYNISDSLIINKIKDKLIFNDFIADFTVNSNVITKVFNNDNEIDYTKPLGTGYKLKTYSNDELINEYTLIVSGDLDGNGSVNAADIMKMKLHILGKNTLNDILFKAGDVNDSNSVNATDIIYLKRYILGKVNNVWGS